MLRRNCPVIKSVGSVVKPKGVYGGERLVKEVGLEAGVKKRDDKVRRCGRNMNMQVREKETGTRLTVFTI